MGKLYTGETPQEVLECNLKLEMEALPLLHEAIACCEECQDYVSRDLLEGTLKDEEEHVDWLKSQLGLNKELGLDKYLQTQI